MADHLKEFLVGLGFQIDDSSFKKFEAGVDRATKEVTSLGLKALGASAAVTAAVTQIAEQYEDLYYASIRANASAAALTTFAYGSRAIGISAAESAASLQRLNEEMLANPGKVALLNMLGIQTAGRDTKQVYEDLIGTLSRMPRFLAYQYGAQFGLSPGEINQRIALRGREAAAEADYQRRLAESGLSVSELTDKSYAYDQALRQLGSSVGIVWDQTANKWLPTMTSTVQWLNGITEGLIRAGRETDGWSSTILSLVSALGGLKAFSWLLSALGMRAAGGAVGVLGGVGAIGIGAAGAAAALLVPTNKSDEPDIYKNGKLTAYGQSLKGGGTGSNASSVMSYFMAQGWSREAAAGIAANLSAESGFNPRATGDYGQAYGVAQWHPDRQRAFRAWAGKDIRSSTLEEQLAFVDFELTRGNETAAGARLKGASSAAGAGAIGSSMYERPANAQGEAFARAALAKQFFDASLSPTPMQVQTGDRTVTQTNNVTISGATNPEQTASAVRREIGTPTDLMRNAGTNFR